MKSRMLVTAIGFCLAGCFPSGSQTPQTVKVSCPACPDLICPEPQAKPLEICSQFMADQYEQNRICQSQISKLTEQNIQLKESVAYWEGLYYQERNRY